MVECASSAPPFPSRRAVVAALDVPLPLPLPATRYAGPADKRASEASLQRAQASLDLPSPTAASIGSRSLLYEPLPADLLWPVRPASPNVAPVLNIGVNRLALLRAVDADVDTVVEGNRRHRDDKSGRRKERRPAAVGGAGALTVEERVDEECDTAAAFHYQQQLKLQVSHPPPLSSESSPQSRVADSVRSLTAASSSAHRYRLYTDSLIDVGLHHEAELRRQWVAMETQARSINRSAERAARRDMRETVREVVNAAKAGKCNEVRDKLKEATQHVDEANEARNSRAAIYMDEQLYLPQSRSQQRETAVMAALAGEKSSVGHINARQPLFDPVPQTNEFVHSTEQHVCFHSFRDDDRGGQRNEAEIALPAVVEHTSRQMEQLEMEREDRRKENSRLRRMHKAEKRKQQRATQAQQLADTEQRRQSSTPAQPQAPPPTAETRRSVRIAHRPQSGVPVSRSGTATTNRRGSAIRAPLWTQGQGDTMLAEVSQFTLVRNREEERRKEDERRAIAEDEKRTREQWLADERREEREREEKQLADAERRQREHEEDEREDRERSLRFFPPSPPTHSGREWDRDRGRMETPPDVQADAQVFDGRGNNSDVLDHFSQTGPLLASRSPERTQASLSTSDGFSQRRLSSFIVGARRTSVTAAGGLPGIGHRRQSSLLPPSSPPLSSSRASTTSRSYRSSLVASSAFPISQSRSRWQNAAGKTGLGKEHLARRFSLVAANDTALTQQQQQQQRNSTQLAQPQHQQPYQPPTMAAMLPAPIDPDSSLVATNYSHDPLHSTYLQQQREQRRTATAQVYDTVKKWLEEQEEEKRNVIPVRAAVTAAGGPGSSAFVDSTASLSFDPQLVTPFSSILAHQPYSPRSQQRHRTMRQQLPLSVSNPAVFAWMRRHAVVPRRTIDPSEEVKYRAMFNELDVDGSGLLDSSELLSALQATHNLRLSEDELHQLLTGMDIRFQGHLSFQQFVSQFASMDEWESLFRIWAKRRQKRVAAEAAAAATQPATSRTRPATSLSTDRPVSPPFRHPPISPIVPPLLSARPASSVSTASLHPSSSSSSARPSTSSTGSSASTGTATPDADVLVPFLLWVPAFHRLQLLESLMAVTLTADEEAAVRQSAEQQSAPTAAADGPGSSGLSLLDLWRVTRTQVRRKRMESDKAEAMRIKQLQAAEGAKAGRKTKGAEVDAGTAGRSRDDSSDAEEEKMMEIWLELHGERERRLDEKRKWRTAHRERKLKRQGTEADEERETHSSFDRFKQAAQMSQAEPAQ